MAMDEILELLNQNRDWLSMQDIMQHTRLSYGAVAVQCCKLYKRNLIKKMYKDNIVYYTINKEV